MRRAEEEVDDEEIELYDKEGVEEEEEEAQELLEAVEFVVEMDDN